MLQDVIATLSAAFVDLPPEQAEQGAQQALEACGERLPADRTSIWLGNPDGQRFECMQAWTTSDSCGRPTEPEWDLAQTPWLGERLAKFEKVHLPRVDALPDGAGTLRERLQAEGVQGCTFIPMVSRGALMGFMRIENLTGPADWDGESLVLLRIVADLLVGLIERKRSDESLQSSQERLARTQRLEVVGRLAGGIAHDFNNVLTAIIGYSDLLEGELGDTDPSLEEVHEIRRAADRASSLIEDILSFSRREPASPKVIDLNMTIAGMEKLVGRVVGDETRLRASLSSDVGSVLADAGRIEQAIVNLAVNARDAIAERKATAESAEARAVPGQIEITTSMVDTARVRGGCDPTAPEPPCALPVALQPGRYAVISVLDNGTGMDDDTRARLFEPFFTTKGEGRGTGLGLATVAAIVTECRGHIAVDSEPGKGAAFHIFLPLVDETASADVVELDQPTHETTPHGAETVLLVDPDEPIRTLLRRVLENIGYEVLEARDADSAEDICEFSGDEIHLLITDLALPRLSGREVAERVLNRRPDAKVLFTSTYPEEMILESGICGPDTDVLEKPFSPHALAMKIRETLDGE